MTITPDGPAELPGPDQVQALISDDELRDRRSDGQRAADAEVARAQTAALTDEGDQPHADIDTLLENWPQPEDRPAGAPMTRIQLTERDGRLGHRVMLSPDRLTVVVPDGDVDAARARLAEALRGRDLDAAFSVREPAVRRDRALSTAEQAFDRRLLVIDRRGGQDLEPALAAVRDAGLETVPNHLMTLGHVIKKGDDYPRVTSTRPMLSPAWVRANCGPSQANVAVIDTGVDRDPRGDGWLDGIDRAEENRDFLDALPRDGRLDLGAGHGDFVAGVIQQIAPSARIRMYRGLDSNGVGDEHTVAALILEAASDGADLIHLSLGTSTADDLPPAVLQTAVELVELHFPRVLVVASAGNMGESRPMWPAALKQVIAVGALDAGDPAAVVPAPWSNFGFWVDCATVGVGIVSTFPPGELPSDPARPVTDRFGPDDWAVWSGTSFAAPQITAVAARLIQTFPQLTPRQALARFLDGRPVLPGLRPRGAAAAGQLTRSGCSGPVRARPGGAPRDRGRVFVELPA